MPDYQTRHEQTLLTWPHSSWERAMAQVWGDARAESQK